MSAPGPSLRFRPASLVRPGLLAAFAALIALGLFDRLSEFGAFQFSTAALLTILLIFEAIDLSSPGRASRFTLFFLGLWIVTAVRMAVQASGGNESPLYPLAYLALAVLSGLAKPGFGALIVVYWIGLEAGWIQVSGHGEGWSALLVHSLYAVGFSAAAGSFIHYERRGREKSLAALSRFERDLYDFQKEDTVFKLSGLSESGRKKAAARSVQALDRAFLSALDTGRRLLKADNAALFLPAPDGSLYLREIATDRQDADLEAAILPGEGLLGFVADNGKPLRVSEEKRLLGSVPYLPPAERPAHLIAAPSLGEEGVGILLVADRAAGDEFSPDDEKLAVALAGQLLEIHEHHLLTKRMESEAAQWKALAELSRRLSRTLNPEPVLDAVMRTGEILCGFHAAAVILPGPENGELTLARVKGEMDARLAGRPVEKEGALIGWVIDQKKELNAGLSGRGRRDPVLGKRLDPAGMASALLHPLPFREFPAGALAFFSKAENAFNRHMTQTTGILADLATVALHNAFLYREAEKKAVTDGLTGMFNHRHFQEKLSDEIERSGRMKNRVALIICDIDHFKKINDGYGHPVGDEVLKAVAQTLRSSVRKVDSAARYGGEEFALILPAADGEGAKELAERARQKIKKLLFHAGGREFHVTISMGAAVFPEDAKTKEALIDLADQALYRAKQTGRDKTVLAGEIKTYGG